MPRRFASLCACVFLLCALFSQSTSHASNKNPDEAAGPAHVQRVADGIVVPLTNGCLKVQVCSADIIRVVFGPTPASFAHRGFMMAAPLTDRTPWRLQKRAGYATVATSRLRAQVNLRSGAISFFDPAGRLIVAERAGGRTLEKAVVQGVSTYHVGQCWLANANESLYGLGQM